MPVVDSNFIYSYCWHVFDVLMKLTAQNLIINSILSSHFRLSFDPDVLLSVNSLVAKSFRNVDSFNATWAFIATWEDIAPYISSLNMELTVSVVQLLRTAY